MSVTAELKINDYLKLKAEADDEASLFKEVARLSELYRYTRCGKCENEDTRFVCRVDSEGNDWLEIVCNDLSCCAKLVYGQTKKGGKIYPKIRWDDLSDTQKEQRSDEQAYAEKHHGFLPNNGWFVYRRKE